MKTVEAQWFVFYRALSRLLQSSIRKDAFYTFVTISVRQADVGNGVGSRMLREKNKESHINVTR